MKLLILLLLLSSFCQAQTLIDVNKIYIRKDVTISNGLVYKYIVEDGNDTARYFNAGAKKYLATVTFTEIGVPVIETIDDTDSRNVYSSGWLTESGKAWTVNFTNDNYHYSVTNNSSIDLSFTGNKIEWFAERRNNHGLARVWIDNIQQSPDTDMYKNTTSNTQELIFSKILVQGAHTIKVQLIGVSPQAAGSLSVVHDRFVVTK